MIIPIAAATDGYLTGTGQSLLSIACDGWLTLKTIHRNPISAPAGSIPAISYMVIKEHQAREDEELLTILQRILEVIL